MSIKVLIVDDSATMRALLQARLSSEPDIEVVGSACNAAEGRELIKLLDPDVVTLDIEMPGMDGLSFLKKIMELRPTPVIIVSGSTQAGAGATARALAHGAVSCYAKSDSSGGLPEDDGGSLAQLVREAARVRFDKKRSVSARVEHRVKAASHGPTSLIAIGSSTGGVEALRKLLGKFDENCPPTLVVQHVNDRFAPAIAETLNAASAARVVLAESDLRIQKGHVYLAPGGEKHLMLAAAGPEGYRTVLRRGELVSGHRPSVDALFHSVAKLGVKDATGVLLTGMGNDGALGLLAMARTGAKTIAQDRSSCVVFGMPRAAIELGAAEIVAPIDHIAEHALDKVAA